MVKKILLLVSLFSFIWVSASAQSFYAELSYQSFRPFIHFQIELGNRPRAAYSPYQSSYMQGYMDGVNKFYSYRPFDRRIAISRAYELGYRDGMRDQELLYRLRGSRLLVQRPFSYNDYYSPYYSIQIWLNQITFNFLRAPEYRLPQHWTRYAHPKLRHYREHLWKQHQWAHFEKKYHQHMRRLEDQGRKHGRDRSYSRNNSHHRSNTEHRSKAMPDRTMTVGHRTRSSSSRTSRSSHHTSRPSRVKRSSSHHSASPQTTHSRSRSRTPHRSTARHQSSSSHKTKVKHQSHSKSKGNSKRGHHRSRSSHSRRGN